jgi:hypothetical protein
MKKIVLHLKFISITIFFKDCIENFDFRLCNYRKFHSFHALQTPLSTTLPNAEISLRTDVSTNNAMPFDL